MLPKHLPRKLREAIGGRQIHVVAAEYRISPSTISAILNGHKVPMQERTVKIITKILKDGGQ